MVDFITKDGKKIPINNGGSSGVKVETKSKPEEKRKDPEEFAKSKSLTSMKDKDLIKAIKNGSKNWKDWDRNERTEKYYAEIERRNQLVPHPKHERVGTVFRDDPNAIPNMEKKVQNFQNEVDYWKKITKFPNRDWQNHSQLGDQRFWALTNASTNLRDTTKKLDKLKSDKESGVKLVRNDTYKGGKKRFFYTEEKDDEK